MTGIPRPGPLTPPRPRGEEGLLVWSAEVSKSRYLTRVNIFEFISRYPATFIFSIFDICFNFMFSVFDALSFITVAFISLKIISQI